MRGTRTPVKHRGGPRASQDLVEKRSRVFAVTITDEKPDLRETASVLQDGDVMAQSQDLDILLAVGHRQ